MTGLETAIRSAIERAGATDAETRQRIYRSARAALEKGLDQRPDLDPAAAAAQRSRFEALVREIEADEARANDGEAVFEEDAAASPEDDTPSVPSIDDDLADRPAGADVPRVSVTPDARLGARESRDAETPPAATVAGEVEPARTRKGRKAAAREEKRERRSRRQARGGIFSTLFLLAVLLVFGGLALWFVDTAGLLDEGGKPVGPGSFGSIDGSNAEGAGLMAGGGFVGDWIAIFKAGKDEPPAAPGAATVQPVKDERGQAVRITSSKAGPDGSVHIAFPAETLARMAGKSWIIALNARSVGGKPTQIAIECSFGSLGDCGRQRMDVAVETTDIVFRVDFTKGTAPGEAGYLLVNSDISGQGKAIDLFAVGVHAAE